MRFPKPKNILGDFGPKIGIGCIKEEVRSIPLMRPLFSKQVEKNHREERWKEAKGFKNVRCLVLRPEYSLPDLLYLSRDGCTDQQGCDYMFVETWTVDLRVKFL